MRSFMPQKGYFPPQKGYFPFLNKNIFKVNQYFMPHQTLKNLFLLFFLKKKNSFEKTWPKCSKYLIKLTLRSTHQNFGSFTHK
jgi:hypothetical protein